MEPVISNSLYIFDKKYVYVASSEFSNFLTARLRFKSGRLSEPLGSGLVHRVGK